MRKFIVRLRKTRLQNLYLREASKQRRIFAHSRSIFLFGVAVLTGGLVFSANIPVYANSNTFSGQITDSTGNVPIGTIKVTLTSTDNSSNNTSTTADSSGDFSLTAAQDTYKVSIDHQYYPNYPSGLNGQQQTYTSADTVTLAASSVIQNFELPPTAAITVHVTDAYGNPVTNEFVNYRETTSTQNIPSSLNPDGYIVKESASGGDTDSSGNATFSATIGQTIPAGNIATADPVTGENILSTVPLAVNGSTTFNLPSGPRPTTPGGFNVSIGSDGFPLISWNTVTGVNDYSILRNGQLEIGTSAQNTSVEDNSGLPSGTYSYYMVASNDNGSSLPTTTITINYTAPSKPSAPTNLTIPSPTKNPVLTWTLSSGVTFYNIYRNGSLIDSINTSSNPATYTDYLAPLGSNSYYVTAVNATGESSYSNSVTVFVGTTPAFTSPASATAGQGVAFSFTVTTTGSPTAALSYRGNLPSGMIFTDNGNGTATISGITNASVGTYLLGLIANNGIGGDVQQVFSLYVNAVTISSAASATGTYAQPFSFTVTTTGNPTPVITKTGTLPPGIIFTDNGNGTATIAGTPTGSASGAYPLTIKAKNSQWTATQSFVLTINRTPTIAAIATQTTTVGTAYSKTVTANGSVTPTFTASGLPNGLALTDNGNGTATIAGTPATGSGGSHTVTVMATNPFGTDTETFTLKVNEAPVITSANSATATVGSVFNLQVTGTGYLAPDYTVTGTLPAGVTFHTETGAFSGTPRAGTAGSYPLTITATNNTGSASQSFSLIVQ